MKSMKKKKSSGHDRITQECLLMGEQHLATPLTKIINESIRTGIVPNSWKAAVVTPILKKGCRTDKFQTTQSPWTQTTPKETRVTEQSGTQQQDTGKIMRSSKIQEKASILTQPSCGI